MINQRYFITEYFFLQGKKVFYHRIIIEGDAKFGKEIVSAKCITSGPVHGISKRDILPAGFTEPE